MARTLTRHNDPTDPAGSTGSAGAAGASAPRGRGLRVCLYNGSGKMAERSGIGSAMRHQRAMLRDAGSRAVEFWERPDIVQLNTVFPDSVIAGAVAKARGIPVVVFAHSTRQDFEGSWIGSRALAPLFEKWLRIVYRGGDVVVTPTPYSRSIIENYGIDAPIRVLTNGVDTEFFAGGPEARARFRTAHGISDDQRVVLSVGHLMTRKGIVEYVDLASSMPEVEFYWAGTVASAAMTPDVRAALDRAPANLHLLGHIPPAEVRDAYAGADLFCFMSHEETQGIVVLEALASGVPVLVRDIPVYADWLPEGVVTYKAATTSEFAHLAQAILDGVAPDLTEAGRSLAAEHDLTRVAEGLASVHDEVLERLGLTA